MTRHDNDAIQISNPKLNQKYWKNMDSQNVTPPSGLTRCLHARGGTKEGEISTEKPANQSALGTLRFVSDTTHPGIAWMLGILGRHIDNPAQRHADAIKPVLRYLSSRKNEDPQFREKARSTSNAGTIPAMPQILTQEDRLPVYCSLHQMNRQYGCQPGSRRFQLVQEKPNALEPMPVPYLPRGC